MPYLSRVWGLVLLWLASSAALGADVTAVRSWRAPDNVRLVLDLSAPVQYRISEESTPAQLILDLDASRAALAEGQRLPANSGPVKAVRLQAKGKDLRLIVDLGAEVSPKSFQLVPNEKYGQRLVLDLFYKNAATVAVADKPAEVPTPPADKVVLEKPVQDKPLPVPQEKLAVDKPAPLDTSATPVKPVIAVVDKTPEKSLDKSVDKSADKGNDKSVEKAVEKAADKTVEKTAADNNGADKSLEKSLAVKQPLKSDDIKGKGRNIIIAIDAGHGGEDSGAVGLKGTYEKNVTLAIARELEALFKAEPGITPYLTRDGDYFIPLQDRRQIARYKYKADIFISVHADSAPSHEAKGASVFALSLKGAGTATSRFARMLAERENRADLIGGVALQRNDDVLRNVLADMVVAGSLEHSLHMGHNILGELDHVGELHAENVEQAGFAVLKEPGMVSLLVETGFISNPAEEKHLTDKAYQEKLARAIFRGALKYCQQYPAPGSYFAWQADRNRGRKDVADSRADEDAGKVVVAANDDQGQADTSAKPVKKVAKAAPKFVKHRVTRGESLTRLAERYQTTLSNLRDLNNLDDDNVRIGQVLKVPAN